MPIDVAALRVKATASGRRRDARVGARRPPAGRRAAVRRRLNDRLARMEQLLADDDGAPD